MPGQKIGQSTPTAVNPKLRATRQRSNIMRPTPPGDRSKGYSCERSAGLGHYSGHVLASGTDCRRITPGWGHAPESTVTNAGMTPRSVRFLNPRQEPDGPDPAWTPARTPRCKSNLLIWSRFADASELTNKWPGTCGARPACCGEMRGTQRCASLGGPPQRSKQSPALPEALHVESRRPDRLTRPSSAKGRAAVHGSTRLDRVPNFLDRGGASFEAFDSTKFQGGEMRIGRKASLVTLLVAGGLVLGSVAAFAQLTPYDPLSLSCVSPSGTNTITLKVEAGASGAPAGFSLQWISADAFEANGGDPFNPNADLKGSDAAWQAAWDSGTPICKMSFSGQPSFNGNVDVTHWELSGGQFVQIQIGDLAFFDETGNVLSGPPAVGFSTNVDPERSEEHTSELQSRFGIS